jgi:hypothetical protein
MKDAEFKVQKDRLTKLQDKWIQPLGLRWWRVNFAYSDQPLKSDAPDGRTCFAQAMVDWEYLNATITFDMQAVADEKDDEQLEQTFVHECCHILVNEMRMWADSEMPSEKHHEAMKHEERVVTQLANAFIWAYEAGIKAAKQNVKKRAKRKS